jgi:hypothetical protein
MQAKELLYECDSVSYIYPDGTPALTDVSFRVWREERIAIPVSYTHLTLPTKA